MDGCVADASGGPSTGRPTRHALNASSYSSSSYAPVRINRTPSALSSPIIPPTTVQGSSSLSLRYPYPLPLASILDLAYILHRQMLITPGGGGNIGVSAHLLVAAGTRAAVLMVVLGCSLRWRSRGGWVAAVAGIGVGAAVWEDCKERLGGKGGRTEVGDPRNYAGAVLGEQTVFLYTTALICIAEYILFLFLLRLSPPSHRTHPFSLRIPGPPRQTEVPFSFSSQDAADWDRDPARTPRSVRFRRYSARSARLPTAAVSPGDRRPMRDATTAKHDGAAWPYQAQPGGRDSRTELNGDSGHDVFDQGQAGARASNETSTPIDDENEDDCDGSEFGYDTGDEGDIVDPNAGYFSDSSVSDSSIIDLPPPLEPQRLIPPSLSMNGDMSSISLAGRALDASSPILGAVVRRTRSARFLPRSWGSERALWDNTSRDRADLEGHTGGSVRQGDEAEARGEAEDRGYGTFGS